MKRVLIILPNLDLGGAETVVMNYFRCFTKVVFDFVVHGEKGFYEDEAISLGAKIFRVPTRSESFFGNISAMAKLYKNEKYDTVVICTEHTFAFIELAVAWFSGVKTRGAWSHFSDYQGASRLKRQIHFFARPLLRLFCNLFLACTKDAAKWLFGNFKNFHLVNNAISLEKFKFNEEIREKIRRKHNISNKYVIGIVARLTKVKNHSFALDIIKEFDNYVLLIAGDGELREEIEEKAKQIREKVIFAGKVTAADYYHAMDVLIAPSLHEGLPLVTIEAQAASLPVIMSYGIPQEAKISEHAYFLSLDDGAEAWAKKIKEVTTQKREQVNLKNSGYCIESEAKKLQGVLCKESDTK